jgi:hypothetical protein
VVPGHPSGQLQVEGTGVPTVAQGGSAGEVVPVPQEVRRATLALPPSGGG